jgi:predicted acylesterase/phospholipase RssA/CRP-like cAMP-binding protein
MSMTSASGRTAGTARAGSAEALRSVPLFTSLPDALRSDIAAHARHVVLRAGEWLCHKGDSGDSLFVVRSGRLEVFADDAEPTPLRLLLRGSVVGELALLTGAPRSASVRARRDSTLLEVSRDDFVALLDEPRFTLGLLRILGTRLRDSRILGQPEGLPVTIAILALDAGPDSSAFADRLSAALRRWRRVARVTCADEPDDTAWAATLDRCEREHDNVLLEGAFPIATAWNEFCLRQADRVICLTGGAVPDGIGDHAELHGCDLLVCGPRFGHVDVAPMVEALGPRVSHVLRPDAAFDRGVDRLARRLAERSIGVVLSGGGARGLAHIGVLEELLAAGVEIDRVAGCSMGAFVGAMFAMGLEPAAIKRHCEAELVRRNPLGDYTLPVYSVVRGKRGIDMLERVFGGAKIEELDREFFAVSCDLVSGELIVHRRGRVADAVAASMSLPGVLPPVQRDGRMLVDGGVLNNLPVKEMAASGEGPVIAVDVTAQFDAPRGVGRNPRLKEVLVRAISLGSVDAVNAAREAADVLITPEVSGVGMLDFSRLDGMVEAGRRAAREALATAPGFSPDARPRTA